jgi:hypothetical protein
VGCSGPAPDRFLDDIPLGKAIIQNRGKSETDNYFLGGNSFPKAPKYGNWVFDVSFDFTSGDNNVSTWASVYQYPYKNQFPSKNDPKQNVEFAYKASKSKEQGPPFRTQKR